MQIKRGGTVRGKKLRAAAGAVLGLWLGAGLAAASPWAQVGDNTLRSDILVLASAGVIDDITMAWPLPWTGILERLTKSNALAGQPDYVRAAAERVKERGLKEVRMHKLKLSASFDAGDPALVRGFDGLGLGTLQGQVGAEAMWNTTALNVAVGARTRAGSDRQTLMLDGSYIAQKLGPVVLYAGEQTHWWGPGWISALSQSNNARPMPQIGISRVRTEAFESPWLAWIGPWQMDFFVGLLDGPRIAKNTAYTGFRFAFSPLPHLEIGFARTTELCGKGHDCKPLTDYFKILNDEKTTNRTNDQGNIDIRYSGSYQSFSYETYVQFMNEDTNPFQHSASSHLYGASVWMPVAGGTGRLTLEYADTVPTYDLWGSGTKAMRGYPYNNWSYLDGMRYRGRSLGFSLDSDSRLLSVQASYLRDAGDSYTLTFHHAEIADAATTHAGSTWRNAVTSEPVIVNLMEARAAVPFSFSRQELRLDLAARLADDQPAPHHGWHASAEIRIAADF
jgi:hypothetical protein